MSVWLECDMSIPKENIEKAWGALLEERRKINEEVDDDTNELDHETNCVLDFIAQSVELPALNGEGKETGTIDRLQNSVFLAGFDGDIVDGALTSLSPHTDVFTEEANVLFWKALAPFVKSGSQVIFQDDDGVYLRWRFLNGEFLEDILAYMVWDDEAEKTEEKDRKMIEALSNCLELLDGLLNKKVTVDSLDEQRKAIALQLIDQVRKLIGET